MKLRLLIGVALLILTGCTFVPYVASTQPNIEGVYDDVSYLECRGNVLERVSACELQKLQEGLGEGVVMTTECKHILQLFRSKIYAAICWGQQGTSSTSH
ncbi:hypothetical protein TI03_02980 [Achromatium sp. WMS1]|nr:hypothetical protein TI03_02980 [Achromatium sp. WMS1]